jgi:hypothetical protein
MGRDVRELSKIDVGTFQFRNALAQRLFNPLALLIEFDGMQGKSNISGYFEK